MYKYIAKDDIKRIILDLNLVDNGWSDAKKIKVLYALSNNIENNYREFKIKKRNGGFRTLAEPSSLLKSIQKNLLNNYLYGLRTSEYVYSYKKGKSIKDNALVHVGKKKILKLDIEGFFDHIEFNLIYNKVFGMDKFPKSIGVLLTSLVCYYGVLPQGAPTSSYISNLVLREFDECIGAWAKSKDIDYSRYCDDMTFSGDFNPSEVIKKVRKALRKYNLELNVEKIRVINRSASQCVTGVVVNERAQVSSKKRRAIRQEVYYIEKYGIDSHLEKCSFMGDKIKYLRSLYGKILFVLNINPEDKEFLEYKDVVRRMFNEI